MSQAEQPSPPQPRAIVHDVRFGDYHGERTSVAKAPFVLAWWSLLRTFGRRRGWTAKFLPFSLLALAFMPGIGVLTVRALLSDQLDLDELPIDILPYVDYLTIIGTLIVLWTAVITPEMICPDIQHRVTTLYFATAVSPMRYLLGKWVASMTAMLGMTLLPVLVLWVGNILFADSVIDALQADADQLPRIVGAGIIVGVFFTTLGLAIASVTGRRAYAIGAFIGLVIGSGALSGALAVGGNDDLSGAVNLVAVPIQLAQRLFEDDGLISLSAHLTSYLVVVGLSTLVLASRFRNRQ